MHTVPHRLAALFQPTTGLLLHSSVEVQYVQKKNANHPDFNDQGIVTVNCLLRFIL